jgi:cell division protein FtsB
MAPKTFSSKQYFLSNIAVAVITGVIAIFGQSLVANKSAHSSEYSTDKQTITKMTDQITALQEEVRRLGSMVLELKEENALLKQQATYGTNYVYSFAQNMPFPAFLKSYDSSTQQFVLKWMNRAYEDTWNIKKYQYIGKPDADIWGEEIAELFQVNDNYVSTSLRPIITHERILDVAFDFEGSSKDWMIAKFPVFIYGEESVSVGGIAIFEEDSKLESNEK